MLAVGYLYLQSRSCVFKTKTSSHVLMCTILMHQSWTVIRVQQFIARIPSCSNHVLYRTLSFTPSGTLSYSLNRQHKVTVPYTSQFISYPSSISRKTDSCTVQTISTVFPSKIKYKRQLRHFHCSQSVTRRRIFKDLQNPVTLL